MNVTLSKRGDYVLRSALCLAHAYGTGRSRKIREVVAEMDVPQTFASQILADLVRAGLATSKAGRDGGYRLALPPSAISVLSVVEAGEGPLHSERCALGEGPCRWEDVCPMHETWSAAIKAMRDALRSTTLEELASRDRALRDGSYEIPIDSHRRIPEPVEMADRVEFETGIDQALRLLARPKELLEAMAEAAHAQAASVLLNDPSEDGAPLVTIRAPISEPLADGTRLSVAWESQGELLSLNVEADLSFRPVDPERSEAQLAGKWTARPSSGSAGGAKDLMAAAARSSARRMLRELAYALEGAVPLDAARPGALPATKGR